LGRKLLRSEHVHHKDGNKKNNAVENLEVLSREDHARSHMTGNKPSEVTKGRIRVALKGLMPGEKCSTSKLKDLEVLQIKVLLREGILSQKEIGERYGVNCRTISGINVERIWKQIPWPSR
jgi:hypothetical protein